MRVISSKSIAGTDREVHCPRGAFISLRLLLESDGMGYSITETYIKNGGPYRWHYKKHLESCYCVLGNGQVKNLQSGEVHIIDPGKLYVLDAHDEHELTADTDMVLLCVFNPPLKGREVHKEDNSYE